MTLPHGLPSFPPLFATVSIYTVNGHRVSPEFIGSRNSVAIAFYAESAGTRPVLIVRSQGSVSNGCCLFRKPDGPIFVCPSQTGAVRMGDTDRIGDLLLLILINIFISIVGVGVV